MESFVINESDLQTITDSSLKEKIHKLLNLFEELTQKYTQLHNENQYLKAELAKLKQQSSPPQLSNKRYALISNLKNKQTQVVWKKSKKKEGLEIDQAIQVPQITTCVCGSKKFNTIRTDKKIVQGIIFKRNNICYIRKEKKCSDCGKVYKGEMPKNIERLSFDPELRTFISYMKFKCRVTQPLIHAMLSDIGIRISTGQISNILLTNSQKLIPSYTQLRVWGIKRSSYLQTDATGHKFKLPSSGKVVDQHIHFLGNTHLSLFKITPRYNAHVINQLLTTRGRRKPLVSDDGGPNGARLFLSQKQLCWIHEIRHYLKLTPGLEVNKRKLQEVITKLYNFYHAAISYRDSPNTVMKRRLQKEFKRLVNKKTGYDALDYRLLLTKRKMERLLFFLDYPMIPIHNNQAERDLRPAVIIRKISHETKSLAGNRSIERHLSVIHTAHKQHLNIWQTLHGLLTDTISPFVLTAYTS